MTQTLISNNVTVFGITNSDVCPYLYAAFNMAQESDPTIITDRSGNGYNLYWLGGTNNPNTPPAGYRMSDHIKLPAALDDNDVFTATTSAEFPLNNTTYSSIYTIRFKDGSMNTLVGTNLIGKRNTTMGYQINKDSGDDPGFRLYNSAGTAVLNVDASTTALPSNEECLLLVAFDASTQTGYSVVRSTTTYYSAAMGSGTPSGATDYASTTNIMAIGQRSKEQASEKYDDLYMYDFQAYHDTSGGPLPANLTHIADLMFRNRGLYIPKGLWP